MTFPAIPNLFSDRRQCQCSTARRLPEHVHRHPILGRRFKNQQTSLNNLEFDEGASKFSSSKFQIRGFVRADEFVSFPCASVMRAQICSLRVRLSRRGGAAATGLGESPGVAVIALRRDAFAEYGRVWAHAMLSCNHQQLAIPDDTDKTDRHFP